MHTRIRFRAPSPWLNQPLTIYHGTVKAQWREITRDGVRVGRGRTNTDFGPGFYVTADRRQAEQWAKELSNRWSDPAVVIWAKVDRNQLASLDCLYFVRGHPNADDYWSFVHHCRAGSGTHNRGSAHPMFYDVVVGPVSRNYRRRAAYEDMDQISFHTPVAEALLNSIPWSGYDPAAHRGDPAG